MSDFENLYFSGQPFSANRRQKNWVRALTLLFCFGLGGTLCCGPLPFSFGQETEDDKAAWKIAETAANAQNDGDYKFATEQWGKLLEKYPNVSLAGKAHYNLGVCHEKLGNHELAAEQFGKAITKLSGPDADQQPLAYFYKAFCQFKIGQRFASQTDEASKKQANIELTTATQTFQELSEKFPKFENIDQALFFQGNAFELLKRSDDAIASYERMLEKTNPHFQFEGMYFLGLLKQEQGKLNDAIKYFDRFHAKLKEQKKESHELWADVDFNKARALMSLAGQKLTEGDAAGAVENFKSAEKIFAGLADSSASEEIKHEAQFQQAYCLANLDEQVRAAQTYELVAAKSDSPFLAQALVNAGRCYLSAKKTEEAVSVFKRATELESPVAVEGASLLSRIYLEQNKFEEAFTLADAWVKQQPDSKMTPYLMYDRADAAFKIPARVDESPALYLSLVEKFPEHSTAPSALYGAAYAYVQLKKSAEAIETVDRFAKSYPKSDLLPDVRELKADTLLVTDESAAEKEYDQLVLDFPDHEKQNRWLLRSAASKFFQKKYQPTIDRLQDRLTAFSEPRQVAEAHYWVGASQFFLDQIPVAISNLEKSLAAGESWRSTDEAMLTLARAYLKNKQVDEAQKRVEQMQQDLPDSSILERGYYYLGEYAYETEKYSDAFKNFEIVYTKFPKSDLVPNAIYTAAWSKLKLNQADESNQLFSKLITDFPKHELAAKALAGRGAAARKTGNTADSIKDLKAVVETTAPGAEKWGAMFELAMAQIESKAWEDAASTLQTLVKEDSGSSRLDAYHHELAWVMHELDRVPESLQHFATIVKLTPVSKHAGEANFHLGNDAYEKEEFEAAAAAYRQAVELSKGDAKEEMIIREKGLYKLGWTFYKQGEFAEAHKEFNRQVEQFPNSTFAADGFFMRAESLFQLKKYDQAHKAFVAALPVVEGSETIDPKLVSLTHLHGAQAANMEKAFQSALDLATPLTEDEEASGSYRADAWLEIGTAQQGLNNASEALKAWEKAKEGSDKTAVRASCLIGDHYFKEKQFETAINQFKEIQYRYFDANASPEIKSWVAYAYYEAARCYTVQVSTATADQKTELIKEAIRQFETLLKKYPDDRLAPEAKTQLEKLRKLPR